MRCCMYEICSFLFYFILFRTLLLNVYFLTFLSLRFIYPAMFYTLLLY
jgi:hypothetical protein